MYFVDEQHGLLTSDEGLACAVDDRPHLFDSCRQRREGFETPGGRVGDEGGQGGLSGSWRPVEDHRGGAGALDKSTQR